MWSGVGGRVVQLSTLSLPTHVEVELGCENWQDLKIIQLNKLACMCYPNIHRKLHKWQEKGHDIGISCNLIIPQTCMIRSPWAQKINVKCQVSILIRSIQITKVNTIVYMQMRFIGILNGFQKIWKISDVFLFFSS